jgi:hypothetical protein
LGAISRLSREGNVTYQSRLTGQLKTIIIRTEFEAGLGFKGLRAKELVCSDSSASKTREREREREREGYVFLPRLRGCARISTMELALADVVHRIANCNAGEGKARYRMGAGLEIGGLP